MEYAELTDEHRKTLRRERVLALESDHFRTQLILAEGGDENGGLLEKCAELERRIEVHTSVT